MRVLVSGATGYLGSALGPLLEREGHEVLGLTRGPAQPGRAVHWEPGHGVLELPDDLALDAVVHLAGESLFGVRWTRAKRHRIRDSRVRGTRLLSETLARRPQAPRVLVSMSGANYYGDRGDAPLTEASASGDGFLAEVCRAWEDAAQPAREAGIRVVHPRMGVLIGPGGFTGLLAPFFRLGLGARVGSGRQYLAWVSREDAARAILHLLQEAALEGPVNLTAPEPATHAEFTRAFARVLSRPAFLKVPGFAVRAGLGQMGRELVLGSLRVLPERLNNSGFRFVHPRIEDALAATFGPS